MNTLRNLQEDLSRKISSLIEDIQTLHELSYDHDNLDFSKEIEKLKEEKDALINTQAYLEKCDKELVRTLESWLSFGCKGKIEIILTGENKDGHKNDKEDSSAHN